MYLSNSLNFADNAWHVFTTSFIFILGACFAVIQYRLFQVPQRLAVGLYIWHTAFCLFYLVYSQTNTADSTMYFIYSQNFSEFPKPGTLAVVFLTALFTQGLMLSYGGVFLIFNILGFIGMLALASVLLKLTRGSSRNVRVLALSILLVPGLSFWSAAIGKDAITFLGACLACWASMDLIKRYPGMIIAIVLFLAVRTHMAAIMLIALAMAMIISERGSVMKRMFLILLTIPTTIYTLIFLQTYLGLEDSSNIVAIADYIEARQGYNTEGGLGIDLTSMPVPVRLLTYLYRPLFIDGGGVLGLMISLENSILLILTIAAVCVWFGRRKSALPGFAWWFLVIYALASWFLLANTTANLGISMRQKWMFMPMILTVIFSYIGKPLINKKRTPI